MRSATTSCPVSSTSTPICLSSPTCPLRTRRCAISCGSASTRATSSCSYYLFNASLIHSFWQPLNKDTPALTAHFDSHSKRLVRREQVYAPWHGAGGKQSLLRTTYNYATYRFQVQILRIHDTEQVRGHLNTCLGHATRRAPTHTGQNGACTAKGRFAEYQAVLRGGQLSSEFRAGQVRAGQVRPAA